MIEPNEFARRVCEWYLDLTHNRDESFSWFVQFFGLRDLIHLMICIRRCSPQREAVLLVSPEIMVHALERNFNGIGTDRFSNLSGALLSKFFSDHHLIEESLTRSCRHPMAVLQHALSETRHESSSRYTLPRYKMIIDNTKDDSVPRLLQQTGILNKTHAFYKLSGLAEGSEAEKLNLVTKVKFAAQQGDKTVVVSESIASTQVQSISFLTQLLLSFPRQLSQMEEVAECFYDLFNQRFAEFKKDGATSYFANIAIGGVSRPSIVHPGFQCIVHVSSSQLDDIPAPFLHRFEKYQLSIEDILSFKLSQLPRGISSVLSECLTKCTELAGTLGNNSLWALSSDETLKSLFISMIPSHSRPHLRQPRAPVEPTISSSAMSLLNEWLTVGLSLDDINTAIATATSNLRGREKIELQKVLDAEGRLHQSQVEQSFHHFTMGQTNEHPLARVLKSVMKIAITRHAMLRLLLVALPENIFLQR